MGEVKIASTLSWAYLNIYYVRYMHAMPFLQNKMPYSPLKTPKTHVV